MPTFLDHQRLSNNRDKGKQCMGRESPNGVVPCASMLPAAALSCQRNNQSEHFRPFSLNSYPTDISEINTSYIQSNDTLGESPNGVVPCAAPVDAQLS